MKQLYRNVLILSMAAMLLLVFTMTGCSRGPNENELKLLEETKAAALSAESKQADCGNQKSDLEKQLAANKQKLEEMKQEKVEVSKRLQAM